MSGVGRLSKVRFPSEPDAITDFLQPYAATLKLAGLEAGLLAPCLYNGLVEHTSTRSALRANFSNQIPPAPRKADKGFAQ
jgi:hypothetical protein